MTGIECRITLVASGTLIFKIVANNSDTQFRKTINNTIYNRCKEVETSNGRFNRLLKKLHFVRHPNQLLGIPVGVTNKAFMCNMHNGFSC